MAYTYTPQASDANAMVNNFGANQSADLQAQNMKNSVDFQNNLANYGGQMYTQAADQSKKQLADTQAGIKTAANSRGLLYSGLRQSAEQGAATNAADNLASTTVGINQGLDQINNANQQQAINTGLDQYKGQVGAAFNAYQQALNSQQQKQQAFGSVLSGGGAIGALALSDKRAKKDIKPADKDVDDLLDNLKPSSFKYKDESNGEGEQTGIMAQDLEKSKVGKKMVHETPKGKMVDFSKSLPTILASQAALHNRLKKLESKK